jgi:hypothetical protein
MARIRSLGLLTVAMVLFASSPAAAGAWPAVGRSAEGLSLASLPGVTLATGGYAAPLQGARPEWYTGEIHDAVQTSGTVAAPARRRSRARWASGPERG